MGVVVGLTGGIGTGKSTALAIFGELGAETASADQIAREILAPGEPATEEVICEFGEEIVLPGGEIDRRKLADMIFSDAEAREKLNRITHPRIIARIKEIIADFRKKHSEEDKAVLAIEIPLLFECGLADIVDRIVVIAAEQETVVNRLMNRDGLSRKEALARISAQMPLSRKMELADVVIWGDRGVERMREDISRAFQTFIDQ